MLKISICPAVEEDAAVIARLNEMCFGQAFPEHLVRRQLATLIRRREETLLVAVYRGQMIGYIHARDDLRTYRAPHKTVLALAVDKDFRRQGVGRQLYEAVVKRAEAEGCAAVSTQVGGSKAAQSFFAAMNLKERLNRRQYIYEFEDKYAYIKERLESNGKKD